MKITSHLFEAYLKCPTKCFLRSLDEQGTGNAYADWVGEQSESYRNAGVERLLHDFHDGECVIGPLDAGLNTAKWRLAVNPVIIGHNLESTIHAVERIPLRGQGKTSQFIPIRFVLNNKLSKDDKLSLTFDALVLSDALGREVNLGRIIHGDDHTTLKVKVSTPMDDLRKRIGGIAQLLSTSQPPNLMLNRHCNECEFRDRCQTEAEKKDDISLLDGITEKLVRKYAKKGVFTATQLSYTYRPRRRKQRFRSTSFTHKPELRALALRTRKICVVQEPDLPRNPIEMFLDIESIIDQEFHYLIGLLVVQGKRSEYKWFWADSLKQEATIWRAFLNEIQKYKEAPVYHYGSFEAAALTALDQRYRTNLDGLKSRLVNLNKFIYGKVYFPVRSNSLKSIGKFLGVSWTSPNASGLQSIIWRKQWEDTGDIQYQHMLVAYNEEDCRAAYALKEALTRIATRRDLVSAVDLPHVKKHASIKTDDPIHHELETVLRFAQTDYDKSKICFRQDGTATTETRDKNDEKKRHRRRRILRPTRHIEIPRRAYCPSHPTKRLRSSRTTTEQILTDFIFTKTGVRKTIARYWAHKGYCSKCHKTYNPAEFNEHGRPRLFGRGLKVWLVYQRVVLRVSYGGIQRLLDDLFNEEIDTTAIYRYIVEISEEYLGTEQLLLQKLLSSPFIHVDETPLSIKGINWYVWVFTDGRHVLLTLRETREATFIQERLKDYRGVLVSDFYAGYDSMKCKQQKCWVHLIRDMNNDLWKNPGDIEFRMFVQQIKELLIPILADVQRYGLKRRHLHKWQRKVKRFYQVAVMGRQYTSEITRHYQKRFDRYRDSLFTFLEHDNVPWHNNTAESAIRHLTLQTKISGAMFEPATHSYLRLLSIAKSCQFQGKSFLAFLLSGEKNVDCFRERKKRRFKPSQNCAVGTIEVPNSLDKTLSNSRSSDSLKTRNGCRGKEKPGRRVELPTYRLQGGCSTN